jgi:hypothetical protein
VNEETPRSAPGLVSHIPQSPVAVNCTPSTVDIPGMDNQHIDSLQAPEQPQAPVIPPSSDDSSNATSIKPVVRVSIYDFNFELTFTW